MPAKIVVLGAGVLGLTVAERLAMNGYEVTVVAAHVPGDYHPDYASPWAGANSMPVSQRGTPLQRYEEETFRDLHKLATQAPEAGIHLQDVLIYDRDKDHFPGAPIADWFNDLLKSDPWFKYLTPNFRVLRKEELPADVDRGTTFQSFCINTQLYLPYLWSKCLAARVTFKRAALKHISQAKHMHASGELAALVVNCTGASSRTLGGVEDSRIVSVRGQLVFVRNVAPAMYTVSGTDDGADEVMYIMTRAVGGGTVLGGSYQKGDTNTEVDMDLAHRIMERAVKYCPALVDGGTAKDLQVIKHAVGFRPWREGGPRVEYEMIDGTKVVHCYGAGGFGYQASTGMASHTCELVKGALNSISSKL